MKKKYKAFLCDWLGEGHCIQIVDRAKLSEFSIPKAEDIFYKTRKWEELENRYIHISEYTGKHSSHVEIFEKILEENKELFRRLDD
tara:strand:+ start:30650 stop:30907 length:258 start_codon:yes stop_codon:yes gene_type:complete